MRIWADVFQPMVFVTVASKRGGRAVLSYESWRYKNRPVTKAECQQCSYKWILPKDCITFADSIKADGDRLTFSHKNREQTVFDFTVSYEHLDAIKESLYNPIGGLEMRGVMYAPGFHYVGTTTNIYASTDYQAWNYSCDNLRTSCVMIDLRYLNHKLYEDTVYGKQLTSRMKDLVKRTWGQVQMIPVLDIPQYEDKPAVPKRQFAASSVAEPMHFSYESEKGMVI